MSLPRAGVELVAEGAPQYFSDLAKGEKAQDKFVDSAKQAAKAADAFGDATKKGADGVDKHTKSTEQGSKSASKFGEIVTGAYRQVGAALTNQLLQAGQKVLAFFTTDMVAAGSRFEATMSGVKAALGPTQEEFKSLSDLALRLGKETAFSAQEAGKAIEALGLNGLNVTQILSGAADATVYLAAATGTDLENAANIATDTMADFNISAEQMGVAINGITGVTVASKFGIDDYRLALAQAGGVAGAVGVSFDDFNTVIAATSSRFASGSDAGTSFKTFLTSLTGNSDKAIDKMKELGLVTEDGANQFFDAAGNLKDMDEVAQLLQDALSGLSEEQTNLALKTIFGSDAMRTAVGFAEQGADGFNRVAEAIAKVDAGAQGEERLNNFSGALEEARGSAETMQIVIAQKLLPFMTKLLKEAVIPALNSLTEMAENSDAVVSGLIAFAQQVGDYVIPAITGLAAAGIAYAIVTIPALIAANTAAIASFAIMALEVAVAAAPFILIAGAIAATVKAAQDLDESVHNATQTLLDGKAFWTESGTALENYGNASDATKAKTKGLADALEYERKVLFDQVEALGQRRVMGTITEAQYQAEMVALNQQADAIEATTTRLNSMIQKELEAEAASIRATTASENQAGALDQLPPKIKLTAEELDKLAKEYDEIMQKGQEALGTLATTHSNFLTDIAVLQATHEEKMFSLMAEKAAATTEDQKRNIDQRIADEKKGYETQLVNQMKAYSEQAAAQRAALGEQLLAYTENQRQLGNITDEKAREISATVVREFGVQRDSAAALFGEMAQTIDGFASGAIEDTASVASQFRKTEDAAVELRQKAQELKDKYIMEIVADFESGRITVDEAKRKLAEVPRRVESEIVVTTTYRERQDSRGDDPSQQSPGRAFGGPVEAGQSYIVGERRPEVFVPEVDGRIVPSLGEYNRRYNPPSDRQGASGGSQTVNNTNSTRMEFNIMNPLPAQVDSLAAMVRLQQVLYYG
jgi:TP901 family phage tail tape measure protein